MMTYPGDRRDAPGSRTASICRWAHRTATGRGRCPRRARPTRCRAGARARKLRRRTLAARLDALAERACARARRRARASISRGLREALELLKLGTLADRPHTRRGTARRELTSELDEPQARARVIADLRANGIDIARAPVRGAGRFHRELRSRAPIRRTTRRSASAGGTRSGTRSMQGCCGGRG